MESAEQPLWRKVNPGGKTKEHIGRVDPVYGDFQSADILASRFDAARRHLLKSETVETLPKNVEEIEFIGLVQMFIAEERKELGLEPGFFIPAERVRFFHPEVWDSPDEKRGGNRGTAVGHYFVAKDAVDVRANPEKGPYSHFAPLAHELRHQAAYVEADLSGEQVIPRHGYRNRRDGTGAGLDEALTEEPVHEYFERYRSIICERLNVPSTDLPRYEKVFGLGSAYYYYRTTVKAVAAEVDEKLYAGEKRTWNNLKRGYFTGETKALEDIRSVWGEDAYKLLMAMGNTDLFDYEKYIADCAAKGYASITPVERVKDLVDLNIQRYFTNELDHSEAQRAASLRDILQYLKDTPDKRPPEVIER